MPGPEVLKQDGWASTASTQCTNQNERRSLPSPGVASVGRRRRDPISSRETHEPQVGVLLHKIGDVANVDTAGAAGKANAPLRGITGHGAHGMRHRR